ncbi:MAG: leucine-rich repeat domain-containing protein [Ruminococcaceae bacterium]|nr:leucine-rich repeat domain-containing protein [Oscillospiraceae bacterium]
MAEYAEDRLFTALLHNDERAVKELKGAGVRLSDIVVYSLTAYKDKKPLENKDDMETVSQILYTFCVKMQKAEEESFIETARRFREELDAPMLYFKSIFGSNVPKYIKSTSLLKCIIDCFDTSQINKKKLMEYFIDSDRTDLLKVCLDSGWLSQPKKRDELIGYANAKERPECTTLLLDFKNRTADLEKERIKEEKKEQRSLNAAPDSVTALKELWSFKKREDGTLSITGYKGLRTEVVVPERIGKNIVTAIDDSAFCPFARRVTAEAAKVREAITSITLPDTVNAIGVGAFWNCKSLESVNIPEGVERIRENAFAECHCLKKIVIPQTVRAIDRRAFYFCDSLKFIDVPEGVETLGDAVFAHCHELMAVVIPKSVKNIGHHIVDMGNKEPKLTGIIVSEGSFAEKYCERCGIHYDHRLTEVEMGSNSEEYCRKNNKPFIYRDDSV